MMNRLTDLPTLRINSAEFLSFSYRGKQYRGMAGDTIATALFANGVRIFARSLKYHRPRGLYSLDGECSNTSVEVNGVPNVRSEKTLLRDGMVVKPQNVWGSPERDLLGFLDRMDWAMPAGFYYRWMHKPYKFWPFCLKQIRKMAGSGVLNPSFAPDDNYDEVYPNADVCVIGGGPAGMSAALAAAEHGFRVILLESRPWLGGSFDYRAAEYTEDMPLYERTRELVKKAEETPNVRIFAHTHMIGAYNNNLVTAFQIGGEEDAFGERYVEIRAESVVVATGCIERPLIFENNERPGVMQVGCAHRLSRTYGLLPGERAVFSIGHDLGLEAAIDLSDLGLSVLAVADPRQDGQDPRLVEGLAERKIPFLRGWIASKAHGNKAVRKVTLSTTEGIRHRVFDCDVLVASAGLSPVFGPLSLVQAKMGFDLHTGFYLPTELPPKVHAAGRMLGLHDLFSIEASGRLAGLSAAAGCGAPVETLLKDAQEKLGKLPGPVRGSKLVMAPVKGKKSFVCFDEDTTIKNIYQGCDMGFDAVELSKRFTAAGTGPGQGGIPGHNLPLIISQYHAESSGPALPSTVRAPLVPTFMATYAGTNHDMYKRSPLHETQEKTGAVFRRIGVWRRARYFSKDFSCREEIENVRNNVGLIDVSTLGKFRLFGPDALKALQRVYVGDMSKIPEGKVKYSAMCNDDGNLIDDGVIAKAGDNDYYFTASTARAGVTVEWFRYHARYDGWEFHMVNLTDAFGAINLAGPNARLVLQKLTDADISNEAFPFMGYRDFTIAETIPVRVMRLGFVGELSFEIHMPSSLTQAVWDLLMDAGKEFGISAFGLEAQSALRMEKGHVIIGQESEIRTTLHDLGLGFLWFREKPEAKAVGAVALKQTEHQEGRLKLIGIRMEDTSKCPEDGSLIVDNEIRGFVCTARKSFTLKESVGLALVESQLAKQGTRLEIFGAGSGDARLYATVAPTPFYDPEGKRLRM
jgi:sarcosine oxidase, subunit alpha